jgi:hypothetical protein
LRYTVEYMASDPTFGSSTPVSDRSLAFGTWYAAHRIAIRKIVVGVLIIVSSVSWAYTIWGFIDHYALSGRQLQHAVAELATSENPRAAGLASLLPVPIAIRSVQVFPTGDGRVDVAALVENANPRHIATITYAFESVEGTSEARTTALLPGRQRWISGLGLESASRTASLRIQKTEWARFSHLEIENMSEYIDARLNIATEDVSFTSTQRASPSASVGVDTPVARATFTLVNKSAFYLDTLTLTVLGMRGSSLVGVSQVVMSDFAGGERRPVSVTWFHNLGAVTSVTVDPYVNVFDAQSFR